MLNKVALRHVPLETLFRGERDGILRRAVQRLGCASYETLVRDDAEKKLKEFGQDVVQRVDGAQSAMGAEAGSILVAIAVRGPRIARLAQQLNSFPAVRAANAEFVLEIKNGPARKKAKK